MSGEGYVIAAALRAEAQDRGRGEWAGVLYTCRSCERPSLSLEGGGWCATCNDGTSAALPDNAAAIRQLHRDTAVMLRRMGFADRAEYHERMAHP